MVRAVSREEPVNDAERISSGIIRVAIQHEYNRRSEESSSGSEGRY
jgi:hypothetical protein